VRMGPLIGLAAAVVLCSSIENASLAERRREPRRRREEIEPDEPVVMTRQIYREPIGPESPLRSNAARESADGRAAARRRRRMQDVGLGSAEGGKSNG
jgi:hypothetical protein